MPNVSSDGRSNGDPNATNYLQDPLAGETGSVTVFNLQGGDLNAGVGLVPEPSTALLSGLALLFGLGRRSRK